MKKRCWMSLKRRMRMSDSGLCKGQCSMTWTSDFGWATGELQACPIDRASASGVPWKRQHERTASTDLLFHSEHISSEMLLAFGCNMLRYESTQHNQ